MKNTPNTQPARRAPHTAPRAIFLVSIMSIAGALAGCQGIQNVQPGAKSIFALLQPPPIEQAARMAADPYSANERYKGMSILVASPGGANPKYVQTYLDNLRDEDPGVRALAARAVGIFGGPEHAPLLTDALKDDDDSVRESAARALQRIHAPAAVGPLLTSLNPEQEEEPSVRREAAIALAQFREPSVLDGLVASLSDESFSVSSAAHDSLRTLTGQDLGPGAKAWRSWMKETKSPFASASGYTYPAFSRARYPWEYIPIAPQPPNENSSPPAGLSPLMQ